MKSAAFTHVRSKISLLLGIFVVLSGMFLVSFQVNSQTKDESAPEPTAELVAAKKQGSEILTLHGGFEIPASNARTEPAGSPRVAATADFDGDGVGDLVVAYDGALAIRRGDINAFAPQTDAAWEAIRDGRFVSPFSAKVRMLPVPASADFVQTGDFNRDTHVDIAFAQHGGDHLFILEGDGKANFPNLRQVEVGGAITTLAGGDVNRLDGLPDLIVGVSNQNGAELQIFQGLGDIFNGAPQIEPVAAPAVSIAVGQLNQDSLADIAAASDYEITILSGKDAARTDEKATAENLRLPQPSGVKAIVAGDLMPDRDARTELAALAPDGTIRIFARGSLDTRPVSKNEHLAEQVREYRAQGQPIPQRILARLSKEDLRAPLKRPQGDVSTWAEAETVASDAPNLQLSPQAILTVGQLSGGSADDLIVLDNAKVTVLPFENDYSGLDETSTFAAFDGKRAAQTFDIEGAPVAALAMKLNYDNEQDLLVLREGDAPVTALISAPQATFTVNSAVDAIDNNLGDNVCNTAGGVCTLRAAIMQANRTAGNDTIMINAGINPTISLGQPDNDGQGTNDQTTGDLDITCVITNASSDGCNLPLASNLNDLVIMGAAGGNTVSAGTFTNYPVDGGGTINTDRVFDVGQDGIFGGGFGGSTGIKATFTNLTIQNGNVREAVNTTLGGGNRAFGGGIRFDGFGNGGAHGTLTLNNTTVNNNQSDNAGGGVYQVYGSLSVSGSTFSGNTTNAGEGGGLFFGAATVNSNVNISGSTFNANTAKQGTVFGTFTANADGGGARINADTNTVTIGTTNFTNNVAQQDGGALKFLGGLVTVTGGTMSGNTARRHGGVVFGDKDTAGATPFLTFSGSTMRNNTANSDNTIFAGDGSAGDGGAVFQDRGVLNLSGATIGGTNAGEPNTATNGGGVAHDFTVVAAAGNTSNQTTVTINGGSINGNVANTDGGGVYFNATNFTTNASTLNIGATTATAMDGNKAKNNGGAINVSGGANANLNNMTIRSNQADSDTSGVGDGGALYQNNGTTAFTGTLTIGASGLNNTAVNGGGIYNAAGTVTVPSGANITFNIATTSGGGIFNAGTINVNGATVSSNLASTGSSVTQSAGTYNSAGTNTLGGNLAISGGTFNTNASTVNLSGNFALSGGIFNGSTGTFNVGGNFSFTGGTFNANTGTFNFNGSSAQTVTGTVTFNNLTVNNASGVTLNSNETVGGTLTLTSGALSVASSNTLTLNSTVTVTGGSINGAAGSTVNYAQGSNGQNVAPGSYGNLTFSNFNKTLPASNVNIAGTFTPGSGTATTTGNTITFNGTAAQTIPVFNYNNLTLNNSAGATLGGNVTVGGALTLTSGTLGVGTNTLTLNGAASQTGGAFSSAATGTVNYNQSSAGQNVLTGNYGNLTFSNFAKTLPSSGTVGVAGTFTPGTATGHTIAGSTFDFNGTGAQTIPAFTYFNLTSSSSGARTLASSGTIGIAGAFTPGTNAYTITGSTIDFNGAGAQTIAAFNYNNLTVSGNRGNANVVFAPGTIGVAGVFNPSVSFAIFVRTGNTFSFNGAGAQTIPQFAYNNLTTATGGTKTLGGTVDVLANLTIGAGTTLDVSASNFPLNVYGNFTNNGTFNARAGTVTLTGSTAQSVSGMTFYNLTANNAAGITFTGVSTINNVLSLQDGFVNTGGFVLMLPVGASATRGGGCNLTNCFVASTSTGGVLKQFDTTANQSFTFPVGTTGGIDNGYSPVILANAASLAGTSGLTVSAIDQAPAGIGSQAITRYWQLTESGNLQTDLTFKYLDADDDGITYPSQLRVFRSTTNMCATDCVDEANQTGSVTGITTFSPWTIAAPLAPTASRVSIGGRLVDVRGRAVSRGIVSITDASGQTRRTTSNALGYFTFEDVEVGDYVIGVKHKNYIFNTNVVNALSDVDDLVIVGRTGEVRGGN